MEGIIGAVSGNLLAVYAVLSSIYIAVKKFMEKHKDVASWLVLRIEKDYRDGKLTNEEKEQIAVELFERQVYPKLPPWKFFIPKFIMLKVVKSMIKSFCKKAQIARKDG